MTRIFWETVLLISGSLFAFGAGQSNSTIVDADLSVEALFAPAPDTWTSRPAATGSTNTTGTAGVPLLPSFTLEKEPTTSTDMNSTAAAANTPTNSDGRSTTTAAPTSYVPPVKKFVAAAVRSHFDDCPDSHRHFCFHGTCRFLILEETPACVCHQGFVGMRCEHADLLAVVATNHRKQTVATVLVLCVIGCVLIMLLCTLLNCWWRQECRRRRRAHHYIPEKSVNALKHGASCCPSESVV